MAVFLISATAALDAQTGPVKSLYVATCTDNKKCKKQQVHRFRFQNGVLISRDVVLETPTDSNGLVITGSSVTENRYLISWNGAVVDTQTGTLYAKETGDRSNYDSGKLYIEQRNKVDRRIRTVVLDLATGKIGLYRDPNFFSGTGVASPDHRRRISYDQFIDRFLILEREGAEPSKYSTKWGFGEFNVTCNWRCTLDKTPPAVWIDNDRFITQRSNGVLVIYDFRTKAWTDLVTISVPKILDSKPTLQKDGDGNFFYETDKLYKLDIENRRYAEVPFIAVPFGFQRTGGNQNKLFRFNDRDLGEFISRRWITTDGYLAVEYQDPPFALWEPIGIKVWGTAANSWTTIKLDYNPIALGWINES